LTVQHRSVDGLNDCTSVLHICRAVESTCTRTSSITCNLISMVAVCAGYNIPPASFYSTHLVTSISGVVR